MRRDGFGCGHDEGDDPPFSLDEDISDLEWYFRTHRAEYPIHTHVVFWGDDDGVAGLSALEGATGHDLWRYLITVAGDGSNSGAAE